MATTSKDKIKIVIFCGGKGTRMWPFSNIGHPKQFNPLIGNKSFFRQTIDRVLSGFDPENIFLSTGQDFSPVIKKQAPEIPTKNIIFEPEMRDNTGAVALSAAKLNYLFPDSVMVLLWGAEHIVKNINGFIKSVKIAASLAYENNKIVHIDMKPTFPSTYNGWVQVGKQIKDVGGLKVYEFVKQVEKPDLEQAKILFQSKKYMIHSGYMATKPPYLLQLMKKYSPHTYKNVHQISQSFGKKDEKQTLAKLYTNFEKNSIDYTLFEKLPKGAQWEIPVKIGWIDVGSWDLLYHGMPKDKNGNLIIGKVELIDVKNCVIIAQEDKTMGLIGLRDMIVVDTDTGILLCPMSQSSQVKPLYKQIYRKK